MNDSAIKAELVDFACPYCGGRSFTEPLRAKQRSEVAAVGFEYRAGPDPVDLGFFKILNHDVEPLCAQLCRQCGTVARWFVENPNRDWIREADRHTPD